MRPQVKSNWSEFTLVRGVFSIFFHINFISLWVWVHFGQYFTSVKLTKVKFSNQCEIACEHIFTWSEFSTLNEMKLWRNLIGRFKLTSVHTPKMKCSCEQTKIFKTSLQLKNNLSFKQVWNFHVNVLLQFIHNGYIQITANIMILLISFVLLLCWKKLKVICL